MTANDNFGSQVQEIGLQVLRNLIQKGTNVEDDTFLMLFVGELASDFFLIMQNMLKVFPKFHLDIFCIYRSLPFSFWLLIFVVLKELHCAFDYRNL